MRCTCSHLLTPAAGCDHFTNNWDDLRPQDRGENESEKSRVNREKKEAAAGKRKRKEKKQKKGAERKKRAAAARARPAGKRTSQPRQRPPPAGRGALIVLSAAAAEEDASDSDVEPAEPVVLAGSRKFRSGEKVQAKYPPNKQWYGATIKTFAQGQCECSNGRLGYCCNL